jgi:DNA-binding response OmpR family regulator
VLPRVTGPLLAETPAAPASDAGAPAILVVEDDPKDLAWLVRTLSDAGYRVETAATGAAALDWARSRVFAAITLDLLLPDIPGHQVLWTIRTEGPNRATPVIVVSVVADQGVSAGFRVDEILAKPVQPAELLAALERVGVPRDGRRPILVIDDDPKDLKIIERALTERGYRPVCLEEGEAGLHAVRAELPALVILDLLMPGMDGFEFLHRLRREAWGQRLPVLVWTGKDLTRRERDLLRGMAQRVLLKSEGSRALLAELESLLPLPGSAAGPEPGARQRVGDGR